MNIEETFPLRYWLNGRREAKRRHETEWRLEQVGIRARRFATVEVRPSGKLDGEGNTHGAQHGLDGPKAGHPAALPPPASAVRGYAGAGEYARALSLRLVFRRARRDRAAAVLIFSDEVMFHPNIAALMAAVELPLDWEIFHLGHTWLDDAPEPVAAGIARVRKGIGFDAFAVRAGAMEGVAKALNRGGERIPLTVEEVLSSVQERLATYACFPNLAWRDADGHDPDKAGKAGYGVGGTQTVQPARAEALFQAMFASGRAAEIAGPALGRTRLALLFLTKGDTHHGDIWREYIAEAPEAVRIFCHPKEPRLLAGGFLEGTSIQAHYDTAWGDVSLVRATLALLRAALEDEEMTHFVLLSESCVPVRPLPEVLKLLDWNPKSRFAWRDLGKASPTEKRRALELPQVPAACWRFQSQWWLLERTAAEWVARADYTDVFAKMEVPDEGYFSTVLCLLGYPLADRVVQTPCTWTHWEGGPHPLEFAVLPTTEVESILESGALFARKFPRGADVGRFGLHRSGYRQTPLTGLPESGMEDRRG